MKKPRLRLARDRKGLPESEYEKEGRCMSAISSLSSQGLRNDRKKVARHDLIIQQSSSCKNRNKGKGIPLEGRLLRRSCTNFYESAHLNKGLNKYSNLITGT